MKNKNQIDLKEVFQKATNAHLAGDLQLAENTYREILNADPEHIDSNHNLGILLTSTKRAAEAINHLYTAIKDQPSEVQYWISYIFVLLELGREVDAKFALKKAMDAGIDGTKIIAKLPQLSYDLNINNKQLVTNSKLDKGLIEAEAHKLIATAHMHWMQGSSDHAIRYCSQALRIQPSNRTALEIVKKVKISYRGKNKELSEAKLKLIMSAYDRKSYDDVIKIAEPLLLLYPSSLQLLNILAVTFKNLGQIETSIIYFQTALFLSPRTPEIHNNLGNAFRETGNFEGAIRHYENAFKLNSTLSEPLLSIGALLKLQGKLVETRSLYERALTIFPNDPKVLNDYANFLSSQKEYSASTALFSRALSKKTDPIILKNLAVVYISLGMFEKARDRLLEAMRLDPRLAGTLNNLALVYQRMGERELALEMYDKAIQLDSKTTDAYNNVLNFLCMNSQKEFNDKFQSYCFNFNKFSESLREHKKYTHGSRKTKSRLKIGFVSGDFCDHPVGYFLVSFLENYDRDKFEIFLFSNHQSNSFTTKKIRKNASHWSDISGRKDSDVASEIFNLNLDILIDLSGHTAKNRLPLFAYMPCRVQATWLGYYGSTGLEAIDFIIGDECVLSNYDKEFYTERPAIMSGSYLCYSPPEFNLEVAQTPAVHNGYVTFGCFNNAKKITRNVLAAWVNIVHSVMNSKIYFKGEGYVGEKKREIVAFFTSKGICENKLIFGVETTHQEHLRSYNKVDIALDPFPYPGGTTTCEAMWMGVPTVTMRGESFISNVGFSIVYHSGCPELCAHSREEYINIAKVLASDISELNCKRLARRNKIMTSSVFNAKKFTANFQDIIIKMIKEK